MLGFREMASEENWRDMVSEGGGMGEFLRVLNELYLYTCLS